MTTTLAPAPARVGQLPLVPAVAFVVVWSSGYIAGPAGVRAMEPISLLGLRFVGATVVAAALAFAIEGRPRLDRGTVVRSGLAGLMFNGLQFTLMYLAFAQGLGATVGALLHSLSPVLTAVLAGVFLGERLRRMQIVGFVIGVVGVVVVLGPDVSESGGPLGLAFGVAALFSLSLGTLGQRWIGSPREGGAGSPWWTATVQFAVPAPFLVILGLLIEGPHPVHHAAHAALAIAFLAVISSVGGLMLLGLLVRRGGASAGASLFFLAPPVTALMAWVAFGDTLDLREWTGLVLAVVGVAVATHRWLSSEERASAKPLAAS